MEYNFEEINLPKPPLFDKYSKEEKENIYLYLTSLDEQSKMIYKIAYKHLETSFNIAKSNGYLNWKNKKS